MTPEKRDASIIAAYKRGETATQIAYAHGLSEKTTYGIIRRARKRMGEDALPRQADKIRYAAADREEQIVTMARQGMRGCDIADRLNMVRGTVYAAITRARAKGLLPPPTFSTDPHRAVQRMKESGSIRGYGLVRDIIDTLTQEQVRYLFREAPKAKSAAEAIAIFLAIHMPEEES